MTLSSGMTKTGLGTLLLTQSDSYSGTTDINAGIVSIENSTSLGTDSGNEIQRITTSGSGTFKLTFTNNITNTTSTTGNINYGATAATVEGDLNGLASIGASGVMVAENYVTSGISQVYTESLQGAIAGTTKFQWSFGASTTASIAYTGIGATDALAIQNALNAATFATIGGLAPFPGSVTVTANVSDTVFTITFGGYLADSFQNPITAVDPTHVATVVTAAANTGVGVVNIVYTVTFAGTSFAGTPQAIMTATPSAGTMIVQISEVAQGGVGTLVSAGAALELNGDPNENGTSIDVPVGNTLDINGSGPSGNGALVNLTGNNTWTPNIRLPNGASNAVVISAASTTQLDIIGTVQDFTTHTPTPDSLTEVGGGTIILAPATSATATASLTSGGVSTVAVTNGGSGFSNSVYTINGITGWAPAVTFSGGGGSGAAAVATVTGGVVTAITVTKAGSGYTSPPTVTIGGNTYTGSTFVDAGILNIQQQVALGVNTSSQQTLQVSGTTGTFTLTLPGYAATAPIPISGLTSSILQSDLDTALAGIDGKVSVTGSGANYVIDFGAPGSTFIGKSLPTLTSTVTGNTTVNTLATTLAGAASFITVANGATLQLQSSTGFVESSLKPLTINGPGVSGAGELENGVGALENVGGTNTWGSTTVTLGSNSSIGASLVASAIATVSGGSVSGIAVLNGGSGFTSPPTVTLTGGGGTGATATANLTNGVVTSISVNPVGSGYTSAPTVTIGTSVLTISKQITDGGNSYGVNKVGTQTVIYADAGSNAYTGLTNVVGGLLQLNSTGTSVLGNLQAGDNTDVYQVQTVTFTGYNQNDQYTLTYNGHTTATLNYYGNASFQAAAMQTALNAVLGAGFVTVIPATAGVFVVSFPGLLASNPAFVIHGTDTTTPAATVASVITTAGAAPAANSAVAQLLASNQIAVTASVSVNSDGLFDLNGFAQTIAALTIAAGTTTTGNTASGGALTVTGPLSITGGGTLTIPEANSSVTVVGAANVNIGTLSAGTNGGASSNFTFNGGLTMTNGTVLLDGTDQFTVNGATAFTDNSFTALGSSCVVTFNGALTLTDSTEILAGASSDMSVTGLLTMSGGLVNLEGAATVLQLSEFNRYFRFGDGHNHHLGTGVALARRQYADFHRQSRRQRHRHNGHVHLRRHRRRHQPCPGSDRNQRVQHVEHARHARTRRREHLPRHDHDQFRQRAGRSGFPGQSHQLRRRRVVRADQQ